MKDVETQMDRGVSVVFGRGEYKKPKLGKKGFIHHA